MSIYGSNALKIHELGMTPLPLKGKRPIFDNWSKYCITLATEEEVENWAEKYPNYNIGIALGPSSQLVAIDVDIDNDEIKALIPDTPFVRRGQKGAVYFYQYHPSITTRKKRKNSVPIDILSKGTQVVIPNSIHPDTKAPYVWERDASLFDSDFREHLPKITQQEILQIMNKANIIFQNISKPSGIKISSGRNEACKFEVIRMADNGMSIEEIAEKIEAYDKANHVPPLFEDKTENAGPPRRFVESILKSIKDAGIILNADDVEVTYTTIAHEPIEANNSERRNESQNSNADRETENISSQELINLRAKRDIVPSFSGLLTNDEKNILPLIYQEINKKSDQDVHAISLCGALSIVATTVGQTWAINIDGRTTYPNLMSLMIAPSGLGKKAPYTFLKSDISRECREAQQLAGKTSYGSSTGVFMGLKSQPVRLDMIEEMSEILSRISDKRSSSNSSIMETLCLMFDSAESFFSPPESKANVKDGISGKIFNPHVNIIGATTPNSFVESASKHMATSGMLPRFLFFSDTLTNNIREWGAMKPSHDTIRRIGKWISGALQIRKVTTSYMNQLISGGADGEEQQIIPRLIHFSEAQHNTLRKIYLQYRHERISIGSGYIMEAFYARKWHQFVKLMLIHECGYMPMHDATFIRQVNNFTQVNLERGLWSLHDESIDFAYRLIETNIQTAKFYMDRLEETISVDPKYENAFNLIEKKIMQSGDAGILRKDLQQSLGGQYIRAKDLNEIISSMLDQEIIFLNKEPGYNNKQRLRYFHAAYSGSFQEVRSERKF